MTHETLEPVSVSEISIKCGVCPFGLDIGGTLTKVAYYVEEDDDTFHQSNPKTEFPVLDSQGIWNSTDTVKDQKKKKCYLKFEYFDTNAIEKLVKWLKDKGLVTEGNRVAVTGGGAYKYEKILQETLNVILIKQEEMECLIAGLTFFIERRNEVFFYDVKEKRRVPYYLKNETIYPILLINIGSGVSIVKVDNPTTFRRITGTCIGGGTVLGLARLLLGNYTFEQVVELSRHGANSLDLVVGDLRGDAAGSLHFPSDTLASSFGRLYIDDQSVSEFHRSNHADIARSLITMVAYNIGYLACLVGRIHGVTRFFFAGKFIHNHDVTMLEIRRAVDFYATYYDKDVSFMNEEGCKIPQQTCILPLKNEICRKCHKKIVKKKHDENIKEKILMEKNTTLLSDAFQNDEKLSCTSTSVVQSAQNTVGSEVLGETLESCDESKALFLTHDGYLGSLGAFLLLHKKLT